MPNVGKNPNSEWENIVYNSDVPIFHYQSDVARWLINLPQLRHEYLILHSIHPGNYREKKSTIDDPQDSKKGGSKENFDPEEPAQTFDQSADIET